mmetsp:Transcript_52426/g.114319  ORF Transcript_52426/g.114319 Transcript_52426/m.114319 type:complete len:204 (+) Transcript_52426:841-1452(+)
MKADASPAIAASFTVVAAAASAASEAAGCSVSAFAAIGNTSTTAIFIAISAAVSAAVSAAAGAPPTAAAAAEAGPPFVDATETSFSTRDQAAVTSEHFSAVITTPATTSSTAVGHAELSSFSSSALSPSFTFLSLLRSLPSPMLCSPLRAPPSGLRSIAAAAVRCRKRTEASLCRARACTCVAASSSRNLREKFISCANLSTL